MIRTSMPPRPGELYDLLEQQVVPEFYARDQNSIPAAWVARIRESMARLTPQFSANRVVRQYTRDYYIPGASAYRARAAQNGAMAKLIVDWQQKLKDKWGALRFGAVNVVSTAENHAFEVQVYLGDLQGDEVRVELYANGMNGRG